MDRDENADQRQHDAGQIDRFFLVGREGRRVMHASAR